MKRFYKSASIESIESGWRVLLDGRPIRTPKKSSLVVPTAALADALADEWRMQDGIVEPSTMLLNRTANTIIDHIVEHRDAVIAEIAKFGATDLICYFADEPEELIVRQRYVWLPLIDWARDVIGARLKCGHGVQHLAQNPEAICALNKTVSALSNWQLAPLHIMVSISGSLVIGLALLRGRLTVAEAWAAGQVDELFQAEMWGEDDFAAKNRADRLADLAAAARFASLLPVN
jgi:chaperone required for assembly of F1-ATPase